MNMLRIIAMAALSVVPGQRVAYRPHLLEDSPRWSADPVTRADSGDLPATVIAERAGSFDVVFQDAAGKWHSRQSVRLLSGVGLYFNDGGSGIVELPE